MVNQLVPQGTLNRALVAVQVIAIPSLNVTSGFFGTRLATLAFEGATADNIPTLTGTTPSPRLYQMTTIDFFLNKSQALAGAWERQRQTNALLGDVNVVTDSPVLQPYYLYNTVLMNIPDLSLTGESNDFPVRVQGYIPINSDLFT